ncbi:hypothetical protein CHS0354_011749 [Potamilus streckersoni]|uniref:Ig-like domain-containing protein n=1 Tax=Potamilus streckersoni TaxID=2493646 RepID=A0AAE0TA61_9BIVA|nr:hypothetical protein CHS0354_011749 [Potamilus streckersoni]
MVGKVQESRSQGQTAIPKMLTVSFNKKIVKPGSSAEEKCQAKGDPKPKYIWKKDGNVLSTDAPYNINPNTGVIKIKSVTLASGEGRYQRLAQNNHGTASSGFWEKLNETIPVAATIAHHL